MKLADESHPFIYGTTVHFSVSTPVDWELKTAEYNYSITITNKGNDMQYTKVLTVFRVIDFSSNKFTGTIPNFIGELKGLQVLNLSNNNILGEIPSSFANMTDLESLDLSNNMLSGEIPRGLTELTSLEVFNVSDNLLEGPIIPEGSQFGTFDNSSFMGNSGLCGTPLSKKCENELEPAPARIAIEARMTLKKSPC
uniref:2-alkenal reductase (NAD(P)(+)) n=1 Tax=Opuntia streptacantha TaxID=393608 RepID=A0A7C8YKM4_OPUST